VFLTLRSLIEVFGYPYVEVNVKKCIEKVWLVLQRGGGDISVRDLGS